MKIVPVEDMPKVIHPVPLDDPMAVFKVCCDLEILCRENMGLGISAVQAGVPWELFLVNDGKFRYFLNCRYEPVGESKIDTLEGCLSLPKRYFRVKRWKTINVNGFELVVEDHKPKIIPYNEQLVSQLDGHGGTVFQHETDHHLGVLISDIGKEFFWTGK